MKAEKTEKPRRFHRFSKLLSNKRRRRRAIDICPKATDDCDYRYPNNYRVCMEVCWPLYNDGQHRILCNNETPHQIFLEISTQLECDAGRIETQGANHTQARPKGNIMLLNNILIYLRSYYIYIISARCNIDGNHRFN